MKQQPLFPRKIQEIEHDWIPLSDGVRLAARYWLPEDAREKPVPAILEYIPYRKRDHTKARDEMMHPYFAGHGYCTLRVDMRGSGDSEGVLLDEYLKQEQDDALEVIAWIADQPWCNGRVGMIGKSWGGINSLQVAARQPPALKCIITMHSTTERFSDDIHYEGGCLLNMNAQWSFAMLCRNAQPPDPQYLGMQWRDLWRQRLEANFPWIITWLSHQQRDHYWRHGSISEDYAAIKCPVYAIGGWADCYSSTVAKLLEGLSVPKKGLVGPWGHNYPHLSTPGPQIGFLQEALRWWDHWLKGIDSGVMEEPAYRVWMQEGASAESPSDERPGRWIAEESWPSQRIRFREYALNENGLRGAADKASPIVLDCPQTVGINSLQWINRGTGDDATQEPEDQQIDDIRALSFDTEPLEDALEILGPPTLSVDLAVSTELAFLCVRLCEVTPEGVSHRVTYGLHNLAFDADYNEIPPEERLQRRRLEVRLADTAHRFAAGNRIRVAVSTSMWPLVWPSPVAPRLTLYRGSSRLRIPLREPRPEDTGLSPFAPPTVPPREPQTVLSPRRPHKVTVCREVGSNRLTVTDVQDSGRVRIDRDGWEYATKTETRRSVIEADPLSAEVHVKGETEFRRGDAFDVRIESEFKIVADRESFKVDASLQAYEKGERVFDRNWSERMPRRNV